MMLTTRAVDYGISDYDMFYFDPDTSWQTEDAVIRQLQGRLLTPASAIEVRNQARVASLVSGKAWTALACAALLQRKALTAS